VVARFPTASGYIRDECCGEPGDPDAFTALTHCDIDRDQTQAQHVVWGKGFTAVWARRWPEHGERNRTGEAARLHAPLRRALGGLQAIHHAECGGLLNVPVKVLNEVA